MRRKRRNRNSEEMSAMGFTDMVYWADEDGWPYPDDDDLETTENYGGNFIPLFEREQELYNDVTSFLINPRMAIGRPLPGHP
jgi:hypothetical protein